MSGLEPQFGISPPPYIPPLREYKGPALASYMRRKNHQPPPCIAIAMRAVLQHIRVHPAYEVSTLPYPIYTQKATTLEVIPTRFTSRTWWLFVLKITINGIILYLFKY